METLESRTLLTTYYVSPSGSDSNGGTSTATPFQTIAKVNTLDLNGGDKVLFQGGQTFTAPAASAINRVVDGGFESGNFYSWTENYDSGGNTTINTSASNLKSGTKSAKVSGSGAGGRGQVLSSITPSASYVLKFWAKISSGTGEGWARIQFFDGTSKLLEKGVRVGASAFQQYSIGIVAPAKFTKAVLLFSRTAGTSTLYADDFTLNQTTGTIILNAADSGTPANPVTVGSYGTGRATINSADNSGLWGDNVAGLLVQDLNFKGSWDASNSTGGNGTSGLVVSNSLPSNGKLDYIRFDDIDASGYKYAGIRVEGNNAKAGYRDVRITNSTAHDNGDSGIDVGGQFDAASTLYSHSNIYVVYCKAWNNSGIVNKLANSGTGIIFGDVDGGTIERCVAWNNGVLCNSNNGGPIGIWAWDSNAVVIQLNESYANKTGANSLDGGGFDLDGGCTNCIMQYNYSHDNDGAGYLLYQFTGARAITGNIIRYNISQNDARAHHYAGIYIGGGSAVKNTDIYNNTVFMSATLDTTIAGIKITGVGTGNKFRNNIIITTGGVNLIDANTTYNTASVFFQGNNYYSSGAAFKIKWSSTIYTSLSTWRATGQEKNGAASIGLSTNPLLVAAGGSQTLGDAKKLSNVTAYQLKSNSPMLNAAVLIPSPGLRDYYGSPLPASGLDIGAFEAVPKYIGTIAGETYRFRAAADGARELFVDTDPDGIPSAVWASGVYDDYTIDASDGDDLLILDLSAGNPLPPGGVTFSGGAGANDVVSVIGSNGDDILTATNTSLTPGGSGPALIYSGVEKIDVDSGAGDDQLLYNSVAAGVNFISGSGEDVLFINSGNYVFAADAGLISSSLAVTVMPGASATFDSSQTLRSLSVAGNAVVKPGGNKTIVTPSLNVAGQFDLADNALLVDYPANAASPMGGWDGSAYTGLTKAIVSGRNNGAWNGPGLVSSSAAGNSKLSLGITEASGLFDFSQSPTALFNSIPIDATTVIIRHTFSGDANLDEAINADDYAVIDAYFIQGGASGFGHGDFNYDGTINADDYALIDNLIAPPLGD